MIHYSAVNISDLWYELSRDCLKSGNLVFDGPIKLSELVGVTFSISNPSLQDSKLDQFADPAMRTAMIQNFHSFEPQFGYKISYGSRIFGLPGEKSFYNNIVDQLRKKPETKSATMNMIHHSDFSDGHVPCIVAIDFKLRDEKLHLFYFARSQDIYKKSFADNIALFVLLEKVAKEVGVNTGSISGMIASAHIYEADFERAKSFVGNFTNK